jgi:hypothetical protein
MTRQQLQAAKQQLQAAGWTHSHSVMHDGGPTGNFGLCFIRRTPTGERETFYLNFKTVGSLPN